jgi:mannose-6-phosphate isomerase
MSTFKVEKPWGHEIRWAINDKYLGKILHIEKGKRLSRQYHVQKDETIYVTKGTLF